MQNTFDTKNEIYAMKRKALGGAINQLFNTSKTDSKIVVPLVKLVAPLGLDLSVYEDKDLTKTLYENIAKNQSLKNLNKVMKDLPLINVVKIGNIISELLVGKRDATKAFADRTVAVNYFIAAVTELNEYFTAIDADYILPLPNLTKQYKRPVGVDEVIRVKPKRKKKSLLGEAVPNDTVTLETTIDPVVEANPEVVIPKLSSRSRSYQRRNKVTNIENREPIVIKQNVQVEKINMDVVMVAADEPLPEVVKDVEVALPEVVMIAADPVVEANIEVAIPKLKSPGRGHSRQIIPIANSEIIGEPQSDRIRLLDSFLVGKKETGEPARTMSSLAKKCESDEEFFNKITTTSYRKHITKKFFNLHKDLFLSYNPDSEEIIFGKSKKDETESKETIHPNQSSFEFEPDEETKKSGEGIKTIIVVDIVGMVKGASEPVSLITIDMVGMVKPDDKTKMPSEYPRTIFTVDIDEQDNKTKGSIEYLRTIFTVDIDETVFTKSKKNKTETIQPNQGSFEFEPDEETKKLIDHLKPLNDEYIVPSVNKARGNYDLLYIIDDYPFITEKPVTFKEKVKTVFSKIFRLK